MTGYYSWGWTHGGGTPAVLMVRHHGPAANTDLFTGVPPERPTLEPFVFTHEGQPHSWPVEERARWREWVQRDSAGAWSDRTSAIPRLIAAHHLSRSPGTPEITALARFTRGRDSFRLTDDAVFGLLEPFTHEPTLFS